MRQISRLELAQFADHLAQQMTNGTSVSYAKNIVTSVNVVLESIRSDRALWIRPSEYLGRRSAVRISAPRGLDRALVNRAADKLIHVGKERVAAVALICRELGLRRKESSLVDLRRAMQQAAHLNKVNITAGTKGGRGKSVDRWVPVSEHARVAIQRAADIAGRDSKLIPSGVSLAQWLTKVSKDWSNVAVPLGLGPLRDLRAAYACDRYSQLTGAPAPAVAGERGVEKPSDQGARAVLSQELGHNRIDVLSAYISSSR